MTIPTVMVMVALTVTVMVMGRGETSSRPRRRSPSPDLVGVSTLASSLHPLCARLCGRLRSDPYPSWRALGAMAVEIQPSLILRMRVVHIDRIWVDDPRSTRARTPGSYRNPGAVELCVSRERTGYAYLVDAGLLVLFDVDDRPTDRALDNPGCRHV